MKPVYAIADDSMFATVYGDNGAPVATLSRPSYFDRRKDGPDSFFRLTDTAGRTIAYYESAPMLRKVESDIAAMSRVRTLRLTDDLPETLTDAEAQAAHNRDVASSTPYRTFQAAALTRALRWEAKAERVRAMLAEEAARRDVEREAESIPAALTRAALFALFALAPVRPALESPLVPVAESTLAALERGNYGVGA